MKDTIKVPKVCLESIDLGIGGAEGLHPPLVILQFIKHL